MRAGAGPRAHAGAHRHTHASATTGGRSQQPAAHCSRLILPSFKSPYLASQSSSASFLERVCAKSNADSTLSFCSPRLGTLRRGGVGGRGRRRWVGRRMARGRDARGALRCAAPRRRAGVHKRAGLLSRAADAPREVALQSQRSLSHIDPRPVQSVPCPSLGRGRPRLPLCGGLGLLLHHSCAGGLPKGAWAHGASPAGRCWPRRPSGAQGLGGLHGCCGEALPLWFRRLECQPRQGLSY